MTNPLVPFVTDLYQGGVKQKTFTVPTGLSQSYYTTDDTSAVSGIIADIINSGTVVINASAVSLQAFATSTAGTTASLETLATSTLAFLTATAGATASIELFLTSTMAFITATANETASIESYLTGVASTTASLLLADAAATASIFAITGTIGAMVVMSASQLARFNTLSGNLDQSASIWNAFNPAAYTTPINSLEANATATNVALTGINANVNALVAKSATWDSALYNTQNAPLQLYLTDSSTGLVRRLQITNGVVVIS
jgi:hypothetical protein